MCLDANLKLLCSSVFDKMLRYECHKAAIPVFEKYAIVETDLNEKRSQKLVDINEKFTKMKNFENNSVNNNQRLFKYFFLLLN